MQECDHIPNVVVSLTLAWPKSEGVAVTDFDKKIVPHFNSNRRRNVAAFLNVLTQKHDMFFRARRSVHGFGFT